MSLFLTLWGLANQVSHILTFFILTFWWLEYHMSHVLTLWRLDYLSACLKYSYHVITGCKLIEIKIDNTITLHHTSVL